jgi:hypothetical protein
MNSKSNNKLGSNLKNVSPITTKPEGIPISNGNIKAKTFARPSKILENYKKQKLSIIKSEENKTDILTEKKESNNS